MLRESFLVPDEVLIDIGTGLALNIPAAYQEYPGWWADQPERYTALRNAREVAGITIEDFPNGEIVRDNTQTRIPMGTRR